MELCHLGAVLHARVHGVAVDAIPRLAKKVSAWDAAWAVGVACSVSPSCMHGECVQPHPVPAWDVA